MIDLGPICAELKEPDCCPALFGCNQLFWGDNAIFHFWKCAPCCGAPDPVNALLCVFNCLCCCQCVHCVMFAGSLGQKCAYFPHYMCGYYLPCWMCIMTRYNLRRRVGARGNICGDACCMNWCMCCALCQMMRAMKIPEWRAVPEMCTGNFGGFIADNLVIMR